MAGRNGPYRKYTDTQKAIAKVYVEAATGETMDSKIRVAAKKTGIPRKTIWGWINKEEKGIDPEARAQLDEMEVVVKKTLEELLDNEIQRILEAMESTRDSATYIELGRVLAHILPERNNLNGTPTQSIKHQIEFVRSGISSLPQHLTPIAIEGNRAEEEI